MLKVIGVILIILSCSAAGIWYSMRLQERLDLLYLQQKMLVMLEREITYGISTLPEALCNTSMRLDEPFRKFLQEVSQQIQRGDDYTFFDIWNENVEYMLTETALTGNDKEQLKNLGKYLGHLDITTQKQMIDMYSKELEIKIQQVRSTLEDKKKLYRSLGVLSGLFLAVTLC